MPRQSILALGLLVFALALGLSASRSPAAEPQAESKGHADGGTQAPAAVAHEEAGHGGGGGGDNPIAPQPSLAIWTVVVFLGLLFVLGKFAWKPLLEALHKREEHLDHVLTETERARNEGEALLAEHRRQLAAAEGQIRTLYEDARKNAQTMADDIARKAQVEAEAAKQRAVHDIATAKDQALSEIFNKTADLAVSVAGRVLGKSLGEDDHRRLIESAIGELGSVPNGHKGARS